jgi:putative molybdopterin biosynthesis protein
MSTNGFVLSTTDQRTANRLLLTPREAAKAMSVCEKTLWSLTKRGLLPSVHIGRAVRYDVADLQAYIERSKGKGVSP